MPGRALERGKGEESPRFQLLLPTLYSLSSWEAQHILTVAPTGSPSSSRLSGLSGFSDSSPFLTEAGVGVPWTQNSLRHTLCPQQYTHTTTTTTKSNTIHTPLLEERPRSASHPPRLLVQQVSTLLIFGLLELFLQTKKVGLHGSCRRRVLGFP